MSNARISRGTRLALVAALLAAPLAWQGAWCEPAHADEAPDAARPAAVSAAAGRPAAVAADTATDSLARMLRSPGGLQRVMSQADSAVRRRGGVHADQAQLLLSWNAPWGHKRARQARTPACADSTREDTLYLSMLPGRVGEHFSGFTAQLVFRATGGDTLGTWWHMEGKGGANPGSLRAEWAGNENFGWKQPFASPGQGFVILDRTPTAARLRMVFAVPYERSGPVVADSVYTLCRVILRHRPERALAGCAQPVCVEWAEASLAFGAKDEPKVRRGERFVAYGGPYALCEPFKGPRVEAWKPKATPMPSGKASPGR